MSGWGRALMSMLGDQKAERTERDSLIERYGGKAGQEGVPSAPIYGQIGGDYGSMEGPNEGTGEGGATDEMKAQAKSAKAFRDLGQHLYGYSREELSTKSLGELRGLARKEESAIVQQEKTQARQDRLAQFAATEKHRRFQEGQGAINTLLSGYNQYQDKARADERLSMDRQNNANLQEARRAKLESDARMAGSLAQFQTLAGEPTGPSRMGGDAAAALLSQPGSGLPDFSAYGPRDTQLTQQPLSMERVAQLGVQTGAWQNPQFNDLAKLYQGAKLDPIGQMNAEAALSNAKTNAAEAARRAKGGTAADKPTITITTKNGDQTVTRKVTETEFAALPQPVQRDAILDGQIAGLEAMEKRGAKKAELTDNGVSEPLFGGKPIGDLLAQLRARRGGGAPAPGPASGGSRFKVEEIK